MYIVLSCALTFAEHEIAGCLAKVNPQKAPAVHMVLGGGP